ncbi:MULTISPECIES: Gfo/Idh/MocA family protein [Oscillatoriales]|uniref:Gfo/Idh/MocA family protein n=1 Tax=Oscillatoriales TaxID=1150 RepID=UPI0001C38704|nr:oxidoreductase [Arthrospira platensis str. Paraca]MDT9313059.1 Gfo/Idh/MocA family oxidoreductase [Limnospira sp. Paracas R14]
MTANKIGIAVIGTGFGQKVHIPAFKEHPRTEIIAVYHRDIDKAKAIASEHNIPHASDQVSQMVTIPEVGAVTIATPPFLHFEMAKEVLHAGKHLLLEKPTTLNVEEAKYLYQLAKDKNCVTTMDFEFRFVPQWLQLEKLLRQGYVGQPRLVKIDWLVSSRADASRAWNWYAQKQKGGGALGAIGSHSFDYIHWLFGPISRLCGQLSTTIAQRPDPAEGGKLKAVDADDTCNLILELADGTPCQVCLSSCTFWGRGHWVEVYGSDGTLILGSDNQKDYIHGFKLWGSKAGEDLAEIAIPDNLQFPKTHDDGRICAFLRVVDRWMEAISRHESLVPSLREGVYSQLLMDLTHESNVTGTWVDVPDLNNFL